ncbi:hypothetical protein ABH955_004136 [Bacillus sp. RC240]|uniref:hypothetical protein n=1 Tax=Bacillus sp. RC240 TaxID=3156285 RepID=UPI003835A4BC
MKLSKNIAILLCSIILLSACSSLTKEEYIDAVAKEQVDVSEGLEKGDDKSLSIEERKKYIEKRISLLKDSKKLSPPSEFKEAHKEYVKFLDIEIEQLEKAKKNISNKSSIFDEYSEKDEDSWKKYNDSFEEKLGVDTSKELLEKRRDYLRVSKDEYVSIYKKEIKDFLNCFKDGVVPTKGDNIDDEAVMALAEKAKGHLLKISATVPPKELEDEVKIFHKAEEKLREAINKLYFDPELEKKETAGDFLSLYKDGLKLNGEFMDKLLEKND